jgi:threonine/homoserine/homoserine lactone efflux protein
LFLEGAVSNMSNPKIAVIHFTFFPQFGLGVKLALERRP